MACALLIDNTTHLGRPLYRVVGHITMSERDSVERLLRHADGPVYAQYDNGEIRLIEGVSVPPWRSTVMTGEPR